MTFRRGRRALVAICCLGALVVPGGGASARRPADTEVQTYQYLYSHGVDTWHYTVSTKAVMPPIVFQPRPTDEWMHIAVDDALGMGVLVHVYQRGDLGERDLKDIYCDRANIYHLVSNEPVEVHLFTGLCPDHDFGFATTGTVTATFARRM